MTVVKTVRYWQKNRQIEQSSDSRSVVYMHVYVYVDRNFPGSPVTKTPSSQCKGPGFDP